MKTPLLLCIQSPEFNPLRFPTHSKCLGISSADPGPPRTHEDASWAQVPTLDTQHSFGGLSPLAFCRDSSGPTLRGSIGGVRTPVSYVTISLGTSRLHSAVQTNFRDSKASMGFALPPKTSHRPAGPKKRDGVQEHPSPQAPGGASHSHLSHPRGDNWIRDCGLLQIVLALTPSGGMGRVSDRNIHGTGRGIEARSGVWASPDSSPVALRLSGLLFTGYCAGECGNHLWCRAGGTREADWWAWTS